MPFSDRIHLQLEMSASGTSLDETVNPNCRKREDGRRCHSADLRWSTHPDHEVVQRTSRRGLVANPFERHSAANPQRGDSPNKQEGSEADLVTTPKCIYADHSKDDGNPADVVGIEIGKRLRPECFTFVEIDVVDDEVQRRVLERLSLSKFRRFPFHELRI